MSELTDLPYATCLRRLREGVVGRAAVCTAAGPRILPVDYAVGGDSLVFRTTPYSVLGSLTGPVGLCFEVGSLDYRHHHGWSVVAVGRGHLLHDPDEVAEARALLQVHPWSGGQRQVFVRLRWDGLTGREVAAAPQGRIRRAR